MVGFQRGFLRRDERLKESLLGSGEAFPWKVGRSDHTDEENGSGINHGSIAKTMILLEMGFAIGFVLALFGVIKRGSRGARWMVICGVMIMTLAFFLVGYTDFKAGLIDALSD